MSKQPISKERLKGREEIFSVLESYKSGIPDATLATERDFYLNVPTVDEKTRPQIDAEAVRSENALLALQRKELQGIADLIITVTDGVDKLKSLKLI